MAIIKRFECKLRLDFKKLTVDFSFVSMVKVAKPNEKLSQFKRLFWVVGMNFFGVIYERP